MSRQRVCSSPFCTHVLSGRAQPTLAQKRSGCGTHCTRRSCSTLLQPSSSLQLCYPVPTRRSAQISLSEPTVPCPSSRQPRRELPDRGECLRFSSMVLDQGGVPRSNCDTLSLPCAPDLTQSPLAKTSGLKHPGRFGNPFTKKNHHHRHHHHGQPTCTRRVAQKSTPGNYSAMA